MKMIARTARWVHPDTFKSLPIWCPQTARGKPSYDATFTRRLSSGAGVAKSEENIKASNALVEALGIAAGKKPKNWTVCHIWGYDDDRFAGKSNVVQDPRFYSCIGNMVWLPTPLKGFTDSVKDIKRYLRVCSFHLYGWACEHEDVLEESKLIRSGFIPVGYPEGWPTGDRRGHPPGTAEFNARVYQAIEKRKEKLRRQLADPSLVYFDHESVRNVLSFWNVKI